MQRSQYKGERSSCWLTNYSLCCQRALCIIQNSQHNFWTWVWPPPFWTMLKKTALFSHDGFPYPHQHPSHPHDHHHNRHYHHHYQCHHQHQQVNIFTTITKIISTNRSSSWPPWPGSSQVGQTSPRATSRRHRSPTCSASHHPIGGMSHLIVSIWLGSFVVEKSTLYIVWLPLSFCSGRTPQYEIYRNMIWNI